MRTRFAVLAVAVSALLAVTVPGVALQRPGTTMVSPSTPRRTQSWPARAC